MKEYKTLKINKWYHVLGFIIFSLICIFITNYVTGLKYSTEGSFDIITGAFVETFILTVFFEFFNSRQQENMEKHLQEHLRNVEKLIKESHK